MFKILCFVIVLYLPSTIGGFIQNYFVVLETGSLCPENNELEIPMRKYQVDRINRTHRVLSADFSLKHPLDNKIEGTAIIDRWTDSGWSKLPIFPSQKDPCKKIMKGSVQLVSDIVIRLGKAMGIKNIEKCDIPSGNYSLTNFSLENIHGEIPFWTGRFKVTSIMRRVDTKKMIFCVINTLSTVETV